MGLLFYDINVNQKLYDDIFCLVEKLLHRHPLQQLKMDRHKRNVEPILIIIFRKILQDF